MIIANIGFIGVNILMWYDLDTSLKTAILNTEVIFWNFLGFFAVNFFYRLTDSKNDTPYYFVLANTMIIVFLGLFTDLMYSNSDIYTKETGKLAIKADSFLYYYAIISICITGIYSLLKMRNTVKKSKNRVYEKQYILLFRGFLSVYAFVFLLFYIRPLYFPDTKLIGLASIIVTYQAIYIFIAIYKYRAFGIDIKENASILFSQVQDNIIILDKNQKTTDMSNSAQQLLNVSSPEEITSFDISNYYKEYSFNEDYSQKEISFSIDQNEYVFLMSQSTLYENNLIKGKVIILNDITERITNELEIQRLNDELSKKIITKNQELNSTKKLLIDREYKEELANITTGALHNAKNLLSSLKVTGEAIQIHYNKSAQHNLHKANKLLSHHKDDLENFILHNPKGKKLLDYYQAIGDLITKEGTGYKYHFERFNTLIVSIEKIIGAQQRYGREKDITRIDILEVIEDSVLMQASANKTIDVQIKSNVEEPIAEIDETKFLHIMVNLIKNAQEALSESDTEDKKIDILIDKISDNFLHITVKDNGIGISSDNLSKMFTHGFTTKESGHGFGLHSCKKYLEEMGGTLSVHSDGIKKGTSFFLNVPECSDCSRQSSSVETDKQSLPNL